MHLWSLYKTIISTDASFLQIFSRNTSSTITHDYTFAKPVISWHWTSHSISLTEITSNQKLLATRKSRVDTRRYGDWFLHNLSFASPSEETLCESFVRYSWGNKGFRDDNFFFSIITVTSYSEYNKFAVFADESSLELKLLFSLVWDLRAYNYRNTVWQWIGRNRYNNACTAIILGEKKLFRGIECHRAFLQTCFICYLSR